MSFIKSGSKFLVNTVTDDYQESPSLTTLSNGNFVASWHSNTKVSGAPSPTMDIFAQIFKADGTKVGGEFLVNTYTTGQQTFSVLAALSNGGFVVSWQSANQVSSPGNDVYAQIFDANGMKVGSEFLVNTYTTGEQQLPTLAALSNGGFVVSWYSQNQVSSSSDTDIYAQRFNANGTKVGGEFLVNTFTSGTQNAPTLAVLSDGGFMISWQSFNQVSSSSHYDIYAQRFNANGEKVGNEFLVNTFTDKEQRLPTMAGLSNGGFVVSWHSNPGTASADYDIYAQIFDANSNKVGSEFLVNTFTAGSQNTPTLVALNDGGFVVSWQSSYQVSGSTQYAIYAQAFSANGDKVGNELLVDAVTTPDLAQPALTGLSDGGFVVSWRAPGVAYLDIYAQRFISTKPRLSLTQSTLSFTEDGAPVIIDGGLTVTDADSTTLSYATVTISTGLVAGEDELLFSNQNGISGSYANGVLSLNGIASLANYQIALRSVRYRNTNNKNPSTGARTISITVNDGVEDSNTVSLGLSIVAVNDVPVLVNNHLTIAQAQTVVLSTSQLSASDDTTPANALQFTVSNVQHGQFKLNGVVATSFTQQAITEGKVSFVHDGTAVAPSYMVIVSDGSLTSPPQAASITFNAAPVLVNNRLTIAQAQTVVLTTSQLSASDDTTPANTLQFTVSNVQRGQFRLDAIMTTTSFTQQNIIDGNVTFVHDGTATAPSYTVIVSDGSLMSPPQAATITFNAAPVLVNNQLTIGQTQTVVLTTSQLSASDDNALANALQFTVSNVQHGQFRLDAIMTTTSFTQQNIIDGNVTFVHDGTATAPSYIVSVSDGSLSSPPQAANITFNAAPVLVNNQLTIAQAQIVVLTTSQLSASDDNALANALQFTVSNVQHGQFRLMGVATANFTQQDIIDGNVSFVQDGTATAPSYIVSVSDGDLTSSAQAASITFNSIPVLVNNQLTIGQAQTVVLSTSQLSASDDTTLANTLQFTVSNVQHGQFRLSGMAATRFTQQDIIDGNVTFVHDGTATAPSYTVSVSDGDLTSSPQTASITFNRMPVLSSGNQTISYYSRTAPVIIDSQLSIQDADSPTLTRATVSISQGLVSAEDELSVITPASLSATYEPTTGVLQLTGNATIADYQQILRQVAYRSQADVPTTHSRTISFSVFDGLLTSQPVNCSLSVIQVNRSPLLINPRSELAVRVNQPFSLSLADTFRDPDKDELTLGLLPTDGQALPDWLNFDASRQVLTGTARTPGSYNFTLFANDTAHAQARMPMTLVAKVVTNNALILGTALGLGLSGSLVLLCCLGILVTAGAIGIGYERKLSQQQALSRKPHRLADLLRKELHLQGVADFSKPTGQAYVNQVNYLITYDEVLFQLYIRCSNDKQLPSLAKELAKLIKLHFKEQKIALQANLLQKETPKMMLSFHQQESFFTAALNRAGYQDLLAAPIELKEIETQREFNPH